MKRAVLLLAVTIFSLAPRSAAAASWVRVVNLDEAGEGLNDLTAWTPQAGNPAATLGQARLKAVEFALAMWANNLESDVSIVVGVAFNPLGGSATAAVLGFGGTDSVYRDFAGAPQPATWYASAVADKLAGLDLDSGSSPLDINLTFNSDVDGAALGASSFYYGFDSATPDGDVDFLAVAAHEITHGLGFATFVDRADGSKALGFDDAYLRHLERHGAIPADFPSMSDGERLQAIVSGQALHWTGPAAVIAGARLTSGAGESGHLRMYAPDPATASSLSHFDVSLSPNELMEPFYLGAPLELGLTAALLSDLGWNTAPVCSEETIP